MRDHVHRDFDYFGIRFVDPCDNRGHPNGYGSKLKQA
jgi:hypothetical protein